jgi:hypothetical protein
LSNNLFEAKVVVISGQITAQCTCGCDYECFCHVASLSLARLRLIEYNTDSEAEGQCLSIEFTITCYSYAENREVSDAHPPF